MSDNPFDNEDNPFADPVAADSSGSGAAPEVYNPFDSSTSASGGTQGGDKKKKKSKKNKKDKYDDTPESAWPDEQVAIGIASGTAAVGGAMKTLEEVSVREQNLLRREAAMLEKEKELDRRERELGRGRIDNWPCKCYPIAYHSISDEIPLQFQPMMKKFYALFWLTFLVLFWNWICQAGAWMGGADVGTGSQFLWSSVYMLFGIVGAWKLWYRMCYYAVRDDNGSKWVVFFITFLAHGCFMIVMFVGVNDWAHAGLIWMFKAFDDDDTLIGIFGLVNLGLTGIVILFSMFLSKQAHTVWRYGGHDKNLKKEMVKTAVRM